MLCGHWSTPDTQDDDASAAKTGVWWSASQAGGRRAGEGTGGLVGSRMCSRMRVTEAVSVMKATMRISVPHCLQTRGSKA